VEELEQKIAEYFHAGMSSIATGVGTHLCLRNLLFCNSLRCGSEFGCQARGFAPWYPQDHFFRLEHAVSGQSASADSRGGETLDYGFFFSVPVLRPMFCAFS
jgi:hypothetical protein